MKKHFFHILVLLCFIASLFIACSNVDSPPAIEERIPTIPPIENFNATQWEAYGDEAAYQFAYEELPPVKSASLRIDGTEETIDPADPRLIRLLNSIVYGYCIGDTMFTQGLITDQEILPCLNADAPVLDVFFDAAEEGTILEKTYRALICSNTCLFFVDGKAYANDFPEPSELYAWMLHPYEGILPNTGHSYEENTAWGNDSRIDLLEYAGFEDDHP